ncbi:MAG: GGDEF domain-containing protein [Clostridia bacterium]|nr:GGDEF domain-containing protein [Clostridia bacterium]
MKRTESNITTRIIVITIILMFLTNVILSAILLHNTRITSTTLINERMLDIANCAAATINGDHLKVLTENGVGTPEYQSVYNSLAVFRDNINKQHLKYIYCAYQGKDGEFYFSIDPSFDAAPFGQKVVHSDGIYKAIEGTPAVDTVPYSDEWGTFFSAYSPVYDSENNIVGLVIVDFDANWYKNQIASDMGIIIFVCAASLVINAVAILLTTSKLRRNLSRLYTELDILADDISDLTDDGTGNDDAPARPRDSRDRISETILRARYLQKKIRVYISDMKLQAFSDTMTGVGNRTAFTERIEDLNKKIADNTADFYIAVFDINGLKRINDEHGHEAGDSAIIDTASILKEICGVQNLYRIGGDEFIAIFEQVSKEEINAAFERVDTGIKEVNKTSRRRAAPLSISKGTVPFIAGLDSHFNDVFKRADEEMYKDKSSYYQSKNDRH